MIFKKDFLIFLITQSIKGNVIFDYRNNFRNNLVVGIVCITKIESLSSFSVGL